MPGKLFYTNWLTIWLSSNSNNVIHVTQFKILFPLSARNANSLWHQKGYALLYLHPMNTLDKKDKYIPTSPDTVGALARFLIIGVLNLSVLRFINSYLRAVWQNRNYMFTNESYIIHNAEGEKKSSILIIMQTK